MFEPDVSVLLVLSPSAADVLFTALQGSFPFISSLCFDSALTSALRSSLLECFYWLSFIWLLPPWGNEEKWTAVEKKPHSLTVPPAAHAQ